MTDTTARDREMEELRADRDRYAHAYRKFLARLEHERARSDEGARLSAADKSLPHECAIASSGIASGFLHAAVMTVRAFEGPEAAQAYAQRATEDTTAPAPDASGHEGNDPMGAPTLHRGLLEHCPAPECQDRALERLDEWGVYCPHGEQIVERDPDRTDPEGHSVGRLVSPWPCHVDGCTLEAFEASEQERQNEDLEAISDLVSDLYR